MVFIDSLISQWVVVEPHIKIDYANAGEAWWHLLLKGINKLAHGQMFDAIKHNKMR